jgi:hypothetical protein
VLRHSSTYYGFPCSCISRRHCRFDTDAPRPETKRQSWNFPELRHHIPRELAAYLANRSRLGLNSGLSNTTEAATSGIRRKSKYASPSPVSSTVLRPESVRKSLGAPLLWNCSSSGLADEATAGRPLPAKPRMSSFVNTQRTDVVLTCGNTVPEVGLELHSSNCKYWERAKTCGNWASPVDISPKQTPKVLTMSTFKVQRLPDQKRRFRNRAGVA